MQGKRRYSTLRKGLGYILVIALSAAGMFAESELFPGAPPGVEESGFPNYFILGPEALGLSKAPTDLHLLPDGRIMVVSQHEVAIGDGVRWETFQQATNQNDFIYKEVAVDDDGRIYASIQGSIAQIVLSAGARWHYAPVISVPYGDPYSRVSRRTNDWLWYSGNAVVSWRPGKALESSKMPASVQHVFSVGTEQFATGVSSGMLYRVHFGGEAEPVAGIPELPSNTVTCSYNLDGQTLLGTDGNGLCQLDGSGFHSVATSKSLGPGSHINDVCRIEADLYAAAVDSVGIVFFNKDRQIVQVLSRALDHRLSRVHKLIYSNGLVWALLDSSVACVQFPSPISNYELMLNSAMRYANPLRHQGKLWMLADGRLMQGAYDADGCLVHFEPDSPPGRFIWSIAEVKGRLFAASNPGIYVRTGTSWQLAAEGVSNARMGVGPSSEPGQFFYVARGEIGWIKEAAGRYAVERIPIQGLGNVYNSVEDKNGTVWLELGTEQVGAISFPNGKPTFSLYGKKDGLGDGWISIFLLDGEVHCLSARPVQRFDSASQKFVEDRELINRIPGFENTAGRPARDPSGRIWFPSKGSLRFFDEKSRQSGSLPIDFQPDSFFMESDGIVWLESQYHLVRYDPKKPKPMLSPLRAQITSVQLSASNYYLSPGRALAPIRYEENSLVMHFCAASNLFGSPVSFEVLLEGGAERWTPTGTVGSASFNHLKEGNYVFHVRPVAGGTPGEEARLEFIVRPPWFRTKLAWVIYVITAVGLVALVAWLFSYMEHRENARLERVVAERTKALNATNERLSQHVAALASSEERYRSLNAELESRVNDRTAELSKTNVDLKREITERQRAEHEVERVHKQLLVASHQAGMAEVATGVLHNVGNVLNSVNVSAGLVSAKIHASKPSTVAKLAQLLKDQGDGLARFLTEDPRGRKVPDFLEQLAVHLGEEKDELGKELHGLLTNIDHIKEIVAMQQSYARVVGVIETVALADLVEDALTINSGAYARHGITLVKDYEPAPTVSVDKHKVLQILGNLLHNSKYACDAINQPTKKVTIRIRAKGPDRVRIEVEDTGIGIPQENLTRIFSQGFTTRKGGHGFGLHSAALAAHELGGTLSVGSDGVGKGATFVLELPLQPPARP